MKCSNCGQQMKLRETSLFENQGIPVGYVCYYLCYDCAIATREALFTGELAKGLRRVRDGRR